MLTPNLKCKNSRIEYKFILSFVVEVLGFAYKFNLKCNLKCLGSIFQIIVKWQMRFDLFAKKNKNL